MTVSLIAEIGCNYADAAIDEAKKMIEAAKTSGARYVKFQLFNEAIIKNSPMKDRLQDYILTEENVKELRQVADATQIGFILTLMYSEAINIAAKYADMIKIRYVDHENEVLIDKAAGTGKELLISVPCKPINAYSPQIHYLYCNPAYPPEPEDFNLELACCCDGFSSHFPHTVFDLAFAINRTYKDCFIEKHVANVEVTNHPIDEAVSITFEELKNFISQLKLIERIGRIRI